MDWINIEEFWRNNDYDDSKRYFYFLLPDGTTQKGFISDFENIAVKYATNDVVF